MRDSATVGPCRALGCSPRVYYRYEHRAPVSLFYKTIASRTRTRGPGRRCFFPRPGGSERTERRRADGGGVPRCAGARPLRAMGDGARRVLRVAHARTRSLRVAASLSLQRVSATTFRTGALPFPSARLATVPTAPIRGQARRRSPPPPRIPRWMPARTTAPFSRSARPSPSLSGALPTRASPTALPSVPCCLAREIALALPCPRTKLVCYLPGFGGRSRCSGIVSTFYVDFSSSDGSLLLWSPIIWDSRPTNSTNQTAPEIHLEHTDTKHYLHTSLRESDSYLNHVLSV